MKIVVVLLVLLLLVWLVLGSVRRHGQGARRERMPPAAERGATQVEGMVTCAHCGVHLPASLALVAKGQTYCNAAHRDGGPRAT